MNHSQTRSAGPTVCTDPRAAGASLSTNERQSVGRKTFRRWEKGLLALPLVVVLYWCQLFAQLRLEWSANDEYNYGWFVPFIAAVLFWRRWSDRPEPAPMTGLAPYPGITWSRMAGWLTILLLLVLLPLRVIEEANVGWRSAQWLHALILVSVSLGLVWHVGGWPWVKHFWFPICFLFLAVPWPSRIENALVQGLMRVVARITVDVVGLAGVPAVCHGNQLQIASGTVSVDGACSGVRSLQTGLMAGLMLAEIYRLKWWKILAVVPAAFFLSFVANVGRTSFLTWSAARQGFERMEHWHKPAGLAVVFVVLAGVWLTTWLLARRGTLYGDRNETPPRTGDDRPAVARSRIKAWWLAGAVSWLVCAETLTAIWFHLGDARSQTNAVWSVQWPTNASGYAEGRMGKLELELLRYDSAKSASWQDEMGNFWSFLALRWGPENKNSFIGRGHTPDLCFVGAGWRLRDQPQPVHLSVNGLDLRFRRYIFEMEGKITHTYLAIWEERSPGGQQAAPIDYGIRQRLKAAVEGKRHQGMKKVEVAISGPQSSQEALTLLQRGLQRLIISETVPAGQTETESASAKAVPQL